MQKEVVDMSLSADNRLLATCSLDKHTIVWDLDTGGMMSVLNQVREMGGRAFPSLCKVVYC